MKNVHASILLAAAVLVLAGPASALIDATADRAAVKDDRQQAMRKIEDANRSGEAQQILAEKLARRAEAEAAADERARRVRALSASEFLSWTRAGSTDAALGALEAARKTGGASAAASAARSAAARDPDAAFRRARLAVVAAVLLALLLVWIVQRRSAALSSKTNGQ